MLRITCPTCNGDYARIVKDTNGLFSHYDHHCPDCNFGIVDAPNDMKVYVNVYKVTSEYGGPEEGGWCYENYTCLEVVPCKNKFSDEIAESLEKDYIHLEYGDLGSVNGGAVIRILIEEKMKESETRERPIYE